MSLAFGWIRCLCVRYAGWRRACGAICASRGGRRPCRRAACRRADTGRFGGRVSFGIRPPWASGRGCRGCCRRRRQRRRAARPHRTGCASSNPACPGPRGWDLCVRPLFRPHVRRVEDDPRQIQQPAVGQPVQQNLVQPTPHTGPRPDQKPAMHGRLGGAETRRQMPPGAATGQHVHDRGEHRLITDVRCSAALRPRPRRRQQRRHDLPQSLRHDPTPATTSHAKINDLPPHRTRCKSSSHLVSRRPCSALVRYRDPGAAAVACRLGSHAVGLDALLQPDQVGWHLRRRSQCGAW
jgi:hypothetical protein